jgi:hypothetical protein
MLNRQLTGYRSRYYADITVTRYPKRRNISNSQLNRLQKRKAEREKRATEQAAVEPAEQAVDTPELDNSVHETPCNNMDVSFQSTELPKNSDTTRISNSLTQPHNVTNINTSAHTKPHAAASTTQPHKFHLIQKLGEIQTENC